MRATLVLLGLLLSVSTASSVAAGSLARVRQQVRAEPVAEQTPTPSSGPLQQAREATRSKRYRQRVAPRPTRPRRAWWAGAVWDCPPTYVVAPACVPARPVPYVQPAPVDYEVFPTHVQPTQWSGGLRLELGGAGDRVSRTGLGLLVESGLRVGVDFDWDAYSEELEAGGHDELHIGQANLTYRVYEHEHAKVRAGVGVGWLGDRYGAEAGINFTLQADLQLTTHWVAHADVDIGTLGDAQTQHVAATVARRFGPCEVFAGYDFRRIGAVDLQGPALGLRLSW